MSSTRDLVEKLAQWDQLAVIALVLVLSQVAAMLWLDNQRSSASPSYAAQGAQTSPAQQPHSSP